VDNKLLVATSNPGKIREIRELLAPVGSELVFLSDFPNLIPEPEETGDSFLANAQLKARYYAQLSGLPTIADDSGLSVLSLDGFPGVTSARWTVGSDEERVSALLELMNARGLTEPLQRRAYFSCIISLSTPGEKQLKNFEGICWGTLSHVPLGELGFGYDPIFIADGQSATNAQLPLSIKNSLSARAIAMRELVNYLAQ
jgi:XTP/dITP diphosphohydrolase